MYKFAVRLQKLGRNRNDFHQDINVYNTSGSSKRRAVREKERYTVLIFIIVLPERRKRSRAVKSQKREINCIYSI